MEEVRTASRREAKIIKINKKAKNLKI